MAKKISEKKENKEIRNDGNLVSITGVISKVITLSERIAIYKLDNERKSPKGNAMHVYITVKDFKPELELEEGDYVGIAGSIGTDKTESNGKTYYNTFIVADSIEVTDKWTAVIPDGINEEIPFN